MKNNPQHIFELALSSIFFCALASVFFTCHVSAGDAITATGTTASISNGPGVTVSGSGSGNPLAGISISASGEASGDITDPNVAGRIGDTDVKVEDMRKALESLDPTEQAQIAADPGALAQAARAILVERAIIKEASSKKWDQQPAIVAHLERIRESTLAGLYLQSVSQPPADYPNEAEINSAYEANKAAVTVPHEFRIAQILISLPAYADEAATTMAKKKVQTVMEELKVPDADFSKIARNESNEPVTAAAGGVMGWVDEKRMPPRIRIQAMTLPLNTVSQPIQLDDGWHIIKVLETKEIAPLSLEEVKARLVEMLRNQRAAADRQKYVVNLLKQTPVVLNEQALTKLLNKTAK
ncbi:MAG: peptidylprolyl isomerase [Chthoniobacteraceae bacterium]